jgi:hypothetical protein
VEAGDGVRATALRCAAVATPRKTGSGSRRYGIGITEFPHNQDPLISKAIEVHATYPITEKEMTEPTIMSQKPWWWLSFADETAEKGSQFRGAVIVRGSDIVDAVRNAHMYGINPSGQVLGKDIPPDLVVPDWAQRKLLTKEECAKVDDEFMQQLR